jgi:hypothetical protein
MSLFGTLDGWFWILIQVWAFALLALAIGFWAGWRAGE